MANEWTGQAACRGKEVRLFYPEGGQRADDAKAWCRACPVQPACLDHALTTHERWGVWGGLTSDERRTLRRIEQVPA